MLRTQRWPLRFSGCAPPACGTIFDMMAGRDQRKLSRRSLLAGPAAAYSLQSVRADAAGRFPEPAADARMTAFYWWFGPSQTKPQVAHELEAMRQAGIGGVYIFPCYPLSADDDLNYPYLSPKFLDVLRFAVQRAKELSIVV